MSTEESTTPSLVVENSLAYAAISEVHHAFVFDTFSRCVQESGNLSSPDLQRHVDALARALRDPSAKTCLVTPVGFPDEFLGWAVSLPASVVFVYVRYNARRGRLGGHHFGSTLLARVQQNELGTVCPFAIWTRSASRIAAKGFPIRYDLDEHEKFLNLAR